VSRDPAAGTDFQNTGDLAAQHFLNRLKTNELERLVCIKACLADSSFVEIGWLILLRHSIANGSEAKCLLITTHPTHQSSFGELEIK